MKTLKDYNVLIAFVIILLIAVLYGYYMILQLAELARDQQRQINQLIREVRGLRQ